MEFRHSSLKVRNISLQKLTQEIIRSEKVIRELKVEITDLNNKKFSILEEIKSEQKKLDKHKSANLNMVRDVEDRENKFKAEEKRLDGISKALERREYKLAQDENTVIETLREAVVTWDISKEELKKSNDISIKARWFQDEAEKLLKKNQAEELRLKEFNDQIIIQQNEINVLQEKLKKDDLSLSAKLKDFEIQNNQFESEREATDKLRRELKAKEAVINKKFEESK